MKKKAGDFPNARIVTLETSILNKLVVLHSSRTTHLQGLFLSITFFIPSTAVDIYRSRLFYFERQHKLIAIDSLNFSKLYGASVRFFLEQASSFGLIRDIHILAHNIHPINSAALLWRQYLRMTDAMASGILFWDAA